MSAIVLTRVSEGSIMIIIYRPNITPTTIARLCNAGPLGCVFRHGVLIQRERARYIIDISDTALQATLSGL